MNNPPLLCFSSAQREARNHQVIQYTLLEMLQHSTGTILSMTRHEHLYEINKYTKNLVTISLEKSNILYTCETTVAVIIKVH